MNQWHKESKRKRTAGILDPGNLLLLAYITLVVCLLIFGSMLDGASAGEKEDLQPGDIRQGELLISLGDGRSQPAPLLSQRVAIKVSGITARIVVEQKFVNSHKNWIEAVYVFPLPDESSVDHLRLRVGERLLEGRIMEKEAAQKTHDQASREGRKSSLLVQNRANIFTSRVANIGPGKEVTVEIEYQQGVRLSDGVFSLRFPMVVGPRYIPGQTLGQSGEQPVRLNSTGWAADTDQVPDASEITPPVDLEKKSETPVELTVDLAAGIALSRSESLYLGIESEEIDKGHYSIRLTSKIKADRDFVLEWQPEDSQAARAALFAENLGKNQYMLLQLMPPQSLPDTPVPREVVFILDVSGSDGRNLDCAGKSSNQAGLKQPAFLRPF
jgi:Ca-activated chloride channel family protein